MNSKIHNIKYLIFECYNNSKTEGVLANSNIFVTHLTFFKITYFSACRWSYRSKRVALLSTVEYNILLYLTVSTNYHWFVIRTTG